MLAGFLVGIIAFQLLLQRVVSLPADETLLVRCLRRSPQTFGQHFAFACENGVLRALTGNVIVRCSWFYPPDPFDLDAIRKLSPCSSRSCHEHVSRVYEGKAEHGDDGFAEEQGIGSERHDRPVVRVARLACAHSSAQAASSRELPWQKN